MRQGVNFYCQPPYWVAVDQLAKAFLALSSTSLFSSSTGDGALASLPSDSLIQGD